MVPAEQEVGWRRVLVLGPSEQGEGCDCGCDAAGLSDEAPSCCWHDNGRGSLGEHAVSGCQCEHVSGAWMYAVHYW